jgi:hypothetical protein
MGWGQKSTFTFPNRLTADIWEKWPSEMRLGYIVGLLHGEDVGMMSFFNVIKESKIFDENKMQPLWEKSLNNGIFFMSLKVTYGQMVEGINGFYKDYANRNIPVYMLLPIVCKRVKGEINQESIEEDLRKLRAKSQEWIN